MATQLPENGDTGTGGAPDATPTEISASGMSRRRFAKTGAGAAGVIMTLVSQPGMAQTVCASPSQSLSKWRSHHLGTPIQCAGLSPGGWKINDNAKSGKTPPPWPAPQDRNTMKFSSVFATGLGSDYSTVLMDTLLSPQSFDKNNLGMHLTATYLNILSNRINFLSVALLQQIWYEWTTNNGIYYPTAGVPWDGAKIVAYLQSTMG